MRRSRLLGRVRVFAIAGVVALGASMVLVAAPAGAADTCGGQTPTITGTNGADYLVGTNTDDPITHGVDVIEGLGGDDTIRGLGGNDIICGGDGDDLINGGLGNDQVFGEGGNDEIQMSDPVLYCSTAASGFDPNAVETAYEDGTSPAWRDCNPANGPSPSKATILDGQTKTLQMNLPMPTPGSTIRDINVRFFINAPVIGGKPDVCSLNIYTLSSAGLQNNMISNDPAHPSMDPHDCNTSGTDLNGTTLDSEALIPENALPATAALNGRFHPSGSLERLYRGIPVCSMSPCTWKLVVQDKKTDGFTASISWWALEINYLDTSSDGTDTVNCGPGPKDTADYTARQTKIVATLADGLADDGQAGENDNLGADDANRCEWLYSGTGADKLTGNKVANDLRGEDGKDVIKGLGGQDNLEGAAGNDKLTGGAAYDTIDGGPGTDTCSDSGDNRVNCETLTG